MLRATGCHGGQTGGQADSPPNLGGGRRVRAGGWLQNSGGVGGFPPGLVTGPSFPIPNPKWGGGRSYDVGKSEIWLSPFSYPPFPSGAGVSRMRIARVRDCTEGRHPLDCLIPRAPLALSIC